MAHPETIDLPTCGVCDPRAEAACTSALLVMRTTTVVTKNFDPTLATRTVSEVAVNVGRRLGRIGCGFNSESVKQAFTAVP